MTATFQIRDADFVLDPRSGSFATVTDTAKLAQDIDIVLRSDISGLYRLVGTVADPYSMRAEASRRIANGLRKLQYVQGLIQAIYRTPKERLQQVRAIDIAPDVNDRRTYRFRVDVLSAGFNPLSLTTSITTTV
jgi:hypothetical protein